LIAWVVDPGTIDPGEGPSVIIGTGATLGRVSGAVFGGLLVATAVFPLLTPADNSMLLFLCPMGAALAAGSIAVAKRAFLRDSEEKLALEDGSHAGLHTRGELPD
jgi:hypothetical protein